MSRCLPLLTVLALLLHGMTGMERLCADCQEEWTATLFSHPADHDGEHADNASAPVESCVAVHGDENHDHSCDCEVRSYHFIPVVVPELPRDAAVSCLDGMADVLAANVSMLRSSVDVDFSLDWPSVPRALLRVWQV